MTTKYQLKNGMKVLLIESHKSPVVAVQMWVKTGSADEKKGLEGISHFIEHLVFKGSEKFGVGDIASAVEGSGGVLNAYTTFDQTVFYVTLSRNFVDTGLEVISEMMGKPTFDAAEIDNEREVVIEEIKRSMDSPHSQASRLLFSTVYKKHPYGIPVIGYDDNIRRVSREEIVRYYHSRYVPQNMNLVVVGDFKTAEMKKKIESYFGGFKRYHLKSVKRAVEPIQKRARVTVREAPFTENFLYISWPTPKTQHKDNIVLSLLAGILGQGESSRLVQKIRNEKHLVNSIGASVFLPKERGFFTISASLPKENLRETLTLIKAEIEKLIKVGPAPEEVAKAIRILESERFYSMETVDGLAELYGHFEFLYNDYKYFDLFLKKTEALAAKEIIRVAKKYLSSDKLNISYLTSEKKQLAEQEITKWAKSLRPQTIKSQVQTKKSARKKASVGIHWRAPKRDSIAKAQKIELKGAGRLVAKQIKGSPVVSVRIGFLGGLRFEDIAHPGSSELTARVWPASTKTRSESDLNHEIENMASGLSAFAGRNSIGLKMTALEPNANKTFDVLKDVLLHPDFAPVIVEREKKLMLEYLKTRNDKPAQQCMLNLMKELYGSHPYGKDPYGGESELQRLNREHLMNYLEQIVRTPNMIVSVVGDIDIKSWEEKLNKLPGELVPGAPSSPKCQFHNLEKNKKHYVHLDKNQTHIALAYPSLKLSDPERYTLDVMQSILSGQGGRLFVELRDKASLAYTVAPLRMDGIEPGYFGAYIGCSPEKGTKAVQMMKAEFQKLVETKVPDDEIIRAKRYLQGRHDIALQRTSHVADSLLFDEMYGLPFNEYEFFEERLSSVTAADIQKLAEQIFAGNSVLSVVGREDVSN